MRVIVRLNIPYLKPYYRPTTFPSFTAWNKERILKEEKIMANSPYTDIGTLNKFPFYLDREDYLTKTGREAPEYNPLFPIKNWEDPAGLTFTGRYLTYDVLEMTDTGGYKVSEVGAEIPFETMLVPRLQAAQVNLMHGGTQPQDAFGGLPIPMPLNKPAINQKVVLQKFGQPAIRNLDVVLPGGTPTGPATNNDLKESIEYLTDLIKAIAGKVGVKIV